MSKKPMGEWIVEMKWPMALHVYSVAHENREEAPSEHQTEKHGRW